MEALLPGLAAVRDVHPLAVHFPIALWSTALLLWVLGLRGDELRWRAGLWLLSLGTLAALVSIGTGLWAADRIGHTTPGHDLVHLHRNLMIAATLLAGATTGLGWAWRERLAGPSRATLLAGIVLTMLVAVVGADRGALLVFGHGIGTRMEGAGPGTAPESPHDHGGHAHRAGEGAG